MTMGQVNLRRVTHFLLSNNRVDVTDRTRLPLPTGASIHNIIMFWEKDVRIVKNMCVGDIKEKIRCMPKHLRH